MCNKVIFFGGDGCLISGRCEVLSRGGKGGNRHCHGKI